MKFLDVVRKFLVEFAIVVMLVVSGFLLFSGVGILFTGYFGVGVVFMALGIAVFFGCGHFAQKNNVEGLSWLGIKIIGGSAPKNIVSDAMPVDPVVPEAPIDRYKKRHYSLSQIKRMDPIQFELFVKRHFEQIGYTVETTRRSGDEGVDLVLTRGERKAIAQCKRYKDVVGQPVVRDLFGTMIHEEADEAYLITTGTISLPAQTWANQKPIWLVDGIELMAWVRESESAVEGEAVIGGASFSLSRSATTFDLDIKKAE